MKQRHNEFIADERMGYNKRRQNAKDYPDKYASIILDGADQSAFGLPHWPVATKSTQKGEKLKFHVIRILELGNINHLTLLTMTIEFPSGANHIIEVFHSWLV